MVFTMVQIDKIWFTGNGKDIFAVYNGVYYKINRIVQEIIEKIQAGETIPDVALAYDVPEEEIDRVLKTFKENKKKRSITRIGTICPSCVCNFLGRIFQFLCKSPTVVYLISIAFVVLSIWHVRTNSFNLLYANIQTWHYLLLMLGILFWHEIGHISAAYMRGIKDLNIEIGVFMVVFAMQVNVNALNQIPHKKRIIVDYAGIYFQMILSVILYAISYFMPTPLIYLTLHINLIMIIGNLMPFGIMDGHWIFSDFFKIDNINTKSHQVIANLFRLRKPQIEKGKQIPTLLYSVFNVAFWIMVIYYTFDLLYHRSFFIEDMYYQLWESNFAFLIILKCIWLLFPYFFFIYFILSSFISND